VKVKEAAYERHNLGIKITRKHLRPLLTSSDYLNLEEGRAALRQAKVELQTISGHLSLLDTHLS
jgi:hypothetical protein